MNFGRACSNTHSFKVDCCQTFLGLKRHCHDQVPVLAYKDGEASHSVYESLICNEFLEEYLPKDQVLLPDHPVAKARARIIIDSFSSKFVPLFYRILLRQVQSTIYPLVSGNRQSAWVDPIHSAVHENLI